MKRFEGFPGRMDFTPIPRVFIRQVLPEIESADEIKILLAVFNIIYQKKGSLRFAGLNELVADASPMTGITAGTDDDRTVIKRWLADAVENHILLAVDVAGPHSTDTLYFINGPAERETVAQIHSGKIPIEGSKPVLTLPQDVPQPDIFSLYENNIGQLTPMIAEELRMPSRRIGKTGSGTP